MTVFRRIAQRLPFESVIYLGDTARVPYGTKSADTVIRYAQACTRILVERGIRMLVVACNTASAFALRALRADLDIPVVGVIEPGAAAAVRETRNKRIGVIGTTGTVASQAYPEAIRARDPAVEVFCKACPLFVPLVEEGWVEGDVPRLAAHAYLSELLAHDVDTLVLGCTHYPLLRDVIASVMGKHVTLVDSAEATAQAVYEALTAMGAGKAISEAPQHRFLVSDSPQRFARIGKRFLGREIAEVEWVDF